jgi:hypothetical protein
VTYVDLSEDEERIILASLDPIGSMASADREELAELLSGIENPDLAGLLDAVARANRIDLDLGTAGLTGPDAVPELPEAPVSRPGDVWLLGGHRLLNGDSTIEDDVVRLMSGRRAVLMATDPRRLRRRQSPPDVGQGRSADQRRGEDQALGCLRRCRARRRLPRRLLAHRPGRGTHRGVAHLPVVRHDAHRRRP